MFKIIKNDWPLSVCFNNDGYLCCADKKHLSGLFFQYELEQLKEAIEKTLLMYKEENITDDDIKLQDEEELKKECERFNNIRRIPKAQKQDDLYLIHDIDANLLKIGRSLNSEKRMKQLQTANGHKLELLCVIKKKGECENMFHAVFPDIRKHGEWFEYNDSIIEKFEEFGGVFKNKLKEKGKKEDDLFEKCWLEYRRKGSKKKAKEYWAKLSDDEKQTILPHIKAYVSTRELTYQKDFERYLRDKIFTTIVFSKNMVVYDPTKNSQKDEYIPQESPSLFWNDYYKCYMYIGFWDGDISDGYTSEDRPNGAKVTLNNGRGVMIWNSETKKWEKK